MTKAEREWEIARSTDIGAGIASSSTATNGASGPSLYDQLRAKDEENATEEEDRQKGLQMPQTLDEDGTLLKSIIYTLKGVMHTC